MKRVLFSIVISMMGVLGFAQQEAQFSHNMYNHFGVNPGYAGFNNAICANTILRSQWAGQAFVDEDGLNGSPQTTLLSAHMPLSFLKNSGAGIMILNDRIGYGSMISFKLAYAYHHHFDAGKLGVGLRLGFLNKTEDFSKFTPLQQDDPVLSGNSGEQKDMMFDFGMGAFYRMSNKLYFGLSITQLRQAHGGSTAHKLKRHFYVTTGYRYPIPGNTAIVLKPSLFIKKDIAATQFDVNCMAELKGKFEGGMSFRPNDAIVLLFGVRPMSGGAMENLWVGYAYDITTSSMIANGTRGSHEIILRYCFNLEVEKSQQWYRNVRFL